MKSLAFAAGLAVAGFATSAAALPSAPRLAGAESAPRAETVAWYCDKRGHCIKAPRAGYVVRPAWEPSCGPGWNWNGYRCVAPVVVVKPRPTVVVKPRPVVVVKPVKPRPAVKIKIN